MKRMLTALIACMLALLACAPALSFADNATQDGVSTKADGAAFALSGFKRNQTGMNKTYEGKSWGYVFPLGKNSADNVCIIPTDTEIVAYVPADAAQAAGLRVDNEADQSVFRDLVASADEQLANGGTLISSLNKRYTFTTNREYEQDGLAFTFCQEIEEGYSYVLVQADTPEAARSAVTFCLSGKVLPASDVVIAGEATWFGKLASFLDPSSMDYRPLWVSLKTAGVAMIFIFILGMLAAWRAMHVKSRWKSLFDSVFTIPMVLPPTVCGFILLVVFGKSTAFGSWLIDHGIELVFSWPSAVLAATVVGFPLMYRTVLGAFEALDVQMLDAARTLGWSEGRIFRKLMLPLAWPSIAAGLVLAFARAMGEFGATLFVAGNYPGITQTMPIAIYFAWMGGNSPVAVFWVVVVIIISFVIILIINLYSAHAQRYRRAGGKASRAIEEVVESNEVGFSIDEAAAAELGFGSFETPDQRRVDARAAGTPGASAPPQQADGADAAQVQPGRSANGKVKR